MTENQRGPATGVPFRARTTAGKSAPSLQANVEPRNKRRLLLGALIVVLSVGLATTWSFIAQRQLASSIVAESSEHLTHAHKAFTVARTRSQEQLVGYCRVLVEDPRLKSTLATEGMDAATVADILQDLGKLRGSGFLMVLSPDGKVFAEAGAAELRGLDLADSTIVKKAQGSGDAAVGAWVLGGKVMDLSIKSIRFGEDIVAYLVVGESVDEAMLKRVSEQTGVHVASALAANIVLTSTAEAKDILAHVASTAGASKPRVTTLDGDSYVTSVVELGETAQSHRLVMARPVAAASVPFQPLRWMLFVPPLLVLISVLFSRSSSRSTRRS